MAIDEQPENDVPEGAAVFPLIPAELGIDPLLLAVIHAAVFLIGSDEEVVHGGAAEESLQYMMTYLQRLAGRRLQKVREDIQVLLEFARQDNWPKQDQHFLTAFLADLGVGGQEGQA